MTANSNYYDNLRLETRVGEIADLGSGSTPARTKHDRYFSNGRIWWVKTGDLNNGLIVNTDERITDTAIAETSCKVYPVDTVLVAMYGGFKQIGRTGVLGVPAAINQALTAISVDKSKVYPIFLQHWLNAKVDVWRSLAGSSRKDPNITKAEVAAFPVLLPPLGEQKVIAEVLSAWDRAIEQTTALIAAKERLKQGLMQQLLTGERRFNGFKGEWRECHLGDLFDDRREPGTDDLPLLSVTLDAGVVRRDSRDAPVRTTLEHEEHLLVRKGDIAYNMMRMWQGGSGMVKENGVVSPAYVVCKPNEQIDSRFADQLFHTPRMIYLFWAYSYGLTDDRRRLYFDGFSRISTRIPALVEQRRIADAVDCLSNETTQLKNRLKALGHQKRGLMQKLLTGEVRVSDRLLKLRAKS